MEDASANDPFVKRLLMAVPPNAKKDGVKSLCQLRQEFHVLKQQLHSLSLVPSAQTASYDGNDFVIDTLESRIFSGIISNIFLVSRSGEVAGDDIPSVIARVSHHLTPPLSSEADSNGASEDDLKKVIDEMGKLRGCAKLASQDWVSDLTDYLNVKLVEYHLNIDSRYDSFSFRG